MLVKSHLLLHHSLWNNLLGNLQGEMYSLGWWQKKGLLSGLVVAEFFPPSILVSYSEDHQPPPEANTPVANPV
jgi:hypothetical protein